MPDRSPPKSAEGVRATGNLPPDPPRLLDVAEREAWEAELRRCLTDQSAGAAAAPAELAEVVVARARRAQRRRLVVGLAAVVVATGLATGVVLQAVPEMGEREYGAITGVIGDPVRNEPEPPEVRLASDERLPAVLRGDVVGEGVSGELVLATSAGVTLPLPGVRQVTSVQRVGEGWVVIAGEPGLRRLWWVAPQQPPVSLLAGMDAIVVDGTRVAWQRASLLATAALSGDGVLGARVSTGLGDEGHPVGFIGDAVLLHRPEPAGAGTWDSWHPDQGSYQPGWTDQVVRVYGTLPDGSAAVGLVPAPAGADRFCLAKLGIEPALTVIQTRCLRAELAPDQPAAISPDGRWLVSGSANEAVLVDLAEAFTAPVATVGASLAGLAPPAAEPVWVDPARVLWPGAGELVQLRPDRLSEGVEAAVERFPLTGAVPVVTEPG